MTNKKGLIYFLLLALKKNRGFKYFLGFSFMMIILRIISQDWDEMFSGAEVLFNISISFILSILASIFFYIIFVFRNEENFIQIFKSFINSSIKELDKIEDMYNKNKDNFFTKDYLISSDGSMGLDKVSNSYIYNIENFISILNHIEEFEYFFEKALKNPIPDSNFLNICLNIYEDNFRYDFKNELIALKIEKNNLTKYYAKIFELKTGRPFINKMDYLKIEPYKSLFKKAKIDFNLKSGIVFDAEKFSNLYIEFLNKVENMREYIKIKEGC